LAADAPWGERGKEGGACVDAVAERGRGKAATILGASGDREKGAAALLPAAAFGGGCALRERGKRGEHASMR
jgi:hypothetical protein